MPLRAQAWGVVSPDAAAIYSANVANAAADVVRANKSLLPGMVCSTFKDEMKKQFATVYAGLGARVDRVTP